MFNRPLSSFVPSVYREVVEMDDIIAAEEIHMNTARTEMLTAFANTFVLTADESGVIMFESMLSIIANPATEDLEFRRQRILNRMSMSPPFTFRFLKQKLNEIIGVGNWTAYIDFSNYTLYVESSATNQSWYHEIEFTINRIKPCNIVFINVPYTSRNILLSEEISYATLSWKYRLGSWKLGRDPFAILSEGGIVKMADVKSIQKSLLEDTAKFVSDDIASVLINDEIVITEFSFKQVSSNLVSIEYDVSPDMTSLVTDIKLRRADGEVLTQSSVYIPVTQSILSKHLITVKEGA